MSEAKQERMKPGMKPGMKITEVDFILACDIGDVSMVTNILDNKLFSVDHKLSCIKNNQINLGMTPLLVSSRSGHINIVEILINKYNANINIKDNQFWNSLHYSCFNGHSNITKLLYSKGCSKNIITMFEKKKPIEFAKYRRFNNIVSIFDNKLKCKSYGKNGIQKIQNKNKQRMTHLLINKKFKPSEDNLKLYLKRYKITKIVYKELFKNITNTSYNQKDILFYAIDTCLLESNIKEYQRICNVVIRIYHNKDNCVKMVQYLMDNNINILRHGSISGLDHIIVIPKNFAKMLCNHDSKNVIIIKPK